MRSVSTEFVALLDWDHCANAYQANSMARRFAAGVKQLGDLDLAYRVEADLVFAAICGRQTISLDTSAATLIARGRWCAGSGIPADGRSISHVFRQQFVDTPPGELDAGCGPRKDRRQLYSRIAHWHGHRAPTWQRLLERAGVPRSERATVAAIDTAGVPSAQPCQPPRSTQG